jgi:DNA repair protein RadA/Sms
VLEARCGLPFGGSEVYLNVAGGLRIAEPAADLAVAAALVSALTGVPTPSDAVVFGEIGLSGDVRTVGQTDLRLREAAKLGFARAILPARPRKRREGRATIESIETVEVARLAELVEMLGGTGDGTVRRAKR